MSFGISGPEPIRSVQPSQKTSDGGAGNLGYFQQEKKKKNEDEQDTIELSSKNEDSEEDEKGNKDEKKPNSIGTKIKTFWFNLHGVFNEVVDENSKEE